jgi:hypothetical protein
MSIAGGNLQVFGATSAVNEHMNLLNVQNGTTFDFGAGSDDSLSLFGASGFFNNLTVKNIETVTGSSFGDTIAIANTSGTTTVTGGWGTDVMTASGGDDHFRFTSFTDSMTGIARDTINSFDAAHDQFVFEGMSGSIQSQIDYVGTNGFSGAAGFAQARLDVVNATDAVIQIDGNGDGIVDMEIGLHNWTGAALQNSNFLVL